MKQTFCHRHRRRRRSGRGYPGRHLRENLQSPRLAPGAQRNQVGLFIRALLTAQLFVMDLQILFLSHRLDTLQWSRSITRCQSSFHNLNRLKLCS